MGNEASQEGDDQGAGGGGPPAPQGMGARTLVSQQSMPLPPQSQPPAVDPGGRRGSAGPQLLSAIRRPSLSSSAPAPPAPAPVQPRMEKRGSVVEMPEDLDLTNLTEEERQVIRNVMARAQSLEEEHPPLPQKVEEPPPEKEVEKCNLCRSFPRECACVECGAQTCKKCSKAIPSGKKHVWMCVACSEKYPRLPVNNRKPEENHSASPIDHRRRTSESAASPSEDRRPRMGGQDGPPPRGRSDSLPGQSPRMMQPQRPQQQQQPMGPRPMQEGSPFRGMRPDHPQQGQPMRPDHPQQGVPMRPQARPRYPGDQQRPQQMKDQRPQHPGEYRPEGPRPQHPGDPRQPYQGDPRQPHPGDPRQAHPGDPRQPHPGDPRQPHSGDPRQPYPGDPRQPHPGDPRQPHPGDPRQPHPGDPRQPHPGDPRQPHPGDPRQPHPGDPRQPHPGDPRQPYPGDPRQPHPGDPRQPHPGDPRQPQSCDPRQPHPGSQHPDEMKPRPMHPEEMKGSRPMHPSEQQRPQQRPPQTQPVDQRTPNDPQRIDQRRGDHSGNNIRHAMDPQRHPNESPRHQEQMQQQQEPERQRGKESKRHHQQKNGEPPFDPIHVPPQSYNHDDLKNSNQRFHGPPENDMDYPQSKVYHPNDPPKPQPQHPIVYPQNKVPPNAEDPNVYPPQDISQEPPIEQRLMESPQKLPPKRNQRLREPPDQQVIPRPQHPQQPPQEFSPQVKQTYEHPLDKGMVDPHGYQDKQQFQKQTSNKPQNQHFQQPPNGERTHATMGEQMFPDTSKTRPEEQQHQMRQDKIRLVAQHPPSNPPPESYSPEKGQFNQPKNNQRQSNNQFHQKNALQQDQDQNGVYVSLTTQESDMQKMFPQMTQDNTSSPPATLPRTKRPEPPQPAGRTTRGKQPTNQAMPRQGTNPFRNDNNPFRRESLPPDLTDTGEYVTVAPRRGSLDERMRTLSNQEQNRLVEAAKVADNSIKPSSDRRLEHQSSFEKHQKKPASDDFPTSNRYQDEEQRRNAINSDPRRQLPSLEQQHRKQQQQQQPVPPEPVPPVPKARTSIPPEPITAAAYNEGRNGGIPRTVPLASLTQSLDQSSRPAEEFYKNEKNFINDLSQHKQGMQGVASQDQRRRNDDLVHPNIVEGRAENHQQRFVGGDGRSQKQPPPTQPRQKGEKPAPPVPSQDDPYVQQGEWGREPRRSKPLPPEDNCQDLEGYQDEAEEQNIDDYFEMIEKAIGRPQQQVISGAKKSAEISKQLMSKDGDRRHSASGTSDFMPKKGQVSTVLQQIDAYNQNQIYQANKNAQQYPNAYNHPPETLKEKNDLNMYEQDKILASKKDFYEMDDDDYPRRDKRDYIIQPTDPRQGTSGGDNTPKRKDYPGNDKLLLHELTPDTRQPSVKHYLEEHKTQPVSYEAFSSAKAMQQDSSSSSSSSSQKPPPAKEGGQAAPYYYAQSSSADDGKKAKPPLPKPDPQGDWSPVSDLSPILDVSPSIEAAEQELMEKFQEKAADGEVGTTTDPRLLLKAGGIPRATSGTISGMLEEFNRALGLPGTSPVDDSGIKSAVSPTSLAISPISNVATVSSIQREYQESFGSPQKTTPSSPQKTPAQPTTPRRSHRRLPQPTVEQMQAAVAMAAQGPKSQQSPQPPPPSTQGEILFGLDVPRVQVNRPVSPSTWKSPELNQSFEQTYMQQSTTHASSTTDVQSTVPSPAPRNQSRNSNSEQKITESAQPPQTFNQQVPTPQARRHRSASYGGNSSSPKPGDELLSRLNGGHAVNNVFSDISSNSIGSPQTPSTPRDKMAGGDSSDTQSEAESIKSVRLRRKLPNLPPDQCSSPSPSLKSISDRSRNGFDLNDNPPSEPPTPSLTPAPSVTVTTSVVTSVENSKQQFSPAHNTSSATLGAPSPTPVGGGSLSPLLGRRMDASRTPSPGSDTSGSKLPQYMQNLKQQLRDELKAVTEERKNMLESRTSPQPPSTPSHHHQQQPTPAKDVKEDSISSEVSKSLANFQAQQNALLKQMQQQQNQLQGSSSVVQQSKPISVAQQNQTLVLSPYRMQSQTSYQSQPQMLQYQNQPQMVQYQAQPHIPYRSQVATQYGSCQELSMYKTMTDSGRRTPQPARTPIQGYRGDDDITIMTTATTTVVSASEQWRQHPAPPTTTVAAPSAAGAGVESLRRLQPSPKKGRRRHTSEIAMPPYAQIEQHYQMLRQQKQMQQLGMQPQPYVQQYYQKVQTPQTPSGGYPRSMEFPSIDSHARAADLLRSRYGGSLGSGLGSTESLSSHGPRRPLNPKIQDYLAENRMAEQQQRLQGPDAYFQTLNNEINRLRRSSENLYRDTIYDKPTYGAPPPMQTPTPVPEIRTSPQTTERRKRKEKKSRKPRSWHPSPYVSEDEDDQLTREEKKAKIKAEIARRRQQIEENMRLHDELCKLAERRDRLEQETTPAYGYSTGGRTTPVAYVPSPTGSVAYRTSEQTLVAQTRPPDNDDTSSVLKAIDEILRKDLYSGPLSRSAWATYSPQVEQPRQQTEYCQSGYVTMPRNRYGEYGDMRQQQQQQWYEEEQLQQSYHQPPQQQMQQQPQADPEVAMDESIMRIASTFPTDEPPDILLSAAHFSPETPAMPLLPDMPTRSRKLLENLGSAPLQPSGSTQSLYQDHHRSDGESNEDDALGHRMQESSSLLRSQRKNSRTPVSKTSQKYDFPVKRILLTRDPKDRSVSGNGLGMKVVGGKEVPGSNGMIGAYVAKIFPGGVVETLGEVKEGDQVLEWNGIPLTGRTYEEVQRIIASSADEVEIVIRCDLNMLEPLGGRGRRSSPGLGTGGPRGGGGGLGPPDGSGGRGGSSPAHSPYSPAGSTRGLSPAQLTKRAGGGGGMVLNNGLTANLSRHSSYENMETDFGRPRGGGLGGAGLVRNNASRSVMSMFPSEWQDHIYEPSFYSSPPSPDDFLEDEFQSRWRQESRMEQVQVCCGPRTAIVYVPIIPNRPLLKSSAAAPAILDRSHLARRSVDHINEYEPLLKSSWREERGFYDLLRPRSTSKVSLYLNTLKEKAEVYELNRKNGMFGVSEEREEFRGRPRAPSDLPGLRPVFVNDWKRPKKVKNEESDDNNNNSKGSNIQNNGTAEKQRNVGSSPEATPYNILPKGCRGSFCVIL